MCGQHWPLQRYSRPRPALRDFVPSAFTSSRRVLEGWKALHRLPRYGFNGRQISNCPGHARPETSFETSLSTGRLRATSNNCSSKTRCYGLGIVSSTRGAVVISPSQGYIGTSRSTVRDDGLTPRRASMQDFRPSLALQLGYCVKR